MKIKPCSPLPCNVNTPVKPSPILDPTKFLAEDFTIPTNGTVYGTEFSNYLDDVSIRCSSPVYADLCGNKIYSVKKVADD